MCWVASLPAGPIVGISGLGSLALEVLMSLDSPVTAAELTSVLLAAVEGAPADADAIVDEFLVELVRRDILTLAPSAETGDG